MKMSASNANEESEELKWDGSLDRLPARIPEPHEVVYDQERAARIRRHQKELLARAKGTLEVGVQEVRSPVHPGRT